MVSQRTAHNGLFVKTAEAFVSFCSVDMAAPWAKSAFFKNAVQDCNR